jgi:glycosyltransferase involved in cell wall biosynthesis
LGALQRDIRSDTYKGKKIVIKTTLMNDDDLLAFKNRKFGAVYFGLLRSADAVIAISSGLYALCVQSGFPKEKIRYIPNGADTTRFYPADAQTKDKLKNELGYSDYAPIFLSVGAIEQRKNYSLLLNVWGDIRRKYNNAIFLIIGPRNEEKNPYYKLLRDQIEKQGVQGVVFLGKRDDIDRWMKIADCFLFGSVNEGFGNVLVEALFSGVPVVARSIPGVTEDILLDRRIARQIASDLPDDFVREIMDVMANGPGSDAFEAVRRRFDIRSVAKEYKKLYAELD